MKQEAESSQDPASFVLSVIFLDIRFEVLSGIGVWIAADLLWKSGCYHLTPRVPTFWTEVDDIIGNFDDIEIMLNDQDCVAIVH